MPGIKAIHRGAISAHTRARNTAQDLLRGWQAGFSWFVPSEREWAAGFLAIAVRERGEALCLSALAVLLLNSIHFREKQHHARSP
jgi:hypothetical protein